MFDLRTLNDVFFKATGGADREVLRWESQPGIWSSINSRELYGRVRALATVFQRWGVTKGDRIAILSENRWEWPVTDFAVLAVGGVDVPLYPTLTAEQVGYMLRDSGAKVAVVSSEEQHRKLLQAGDLPELQQVVVMDEVALEGVENFSSLLANGNAPQTLDAGFDELLRSSKAEDLATIIYTSGTTGEPKGVMLTHGNLASNINVSTSEIGFDQNDLCISFLPLSHVTARHVDYALMCHGAVLAYCPKFDQLPAAMKAVRPTVFVGVPRVYEKIRQAVEGKAGASPIRAKLLSLALAAGGLHRERTLRGEVPTSVSWRLSDRLVLSKIKDAFGGRVHTFISGGAPLGMDTAGWFADAGIRIFEGYGLTETSPVISLNTPKAHRIGSVGRLLPNVNVRFAEDGELEVRGPAVFQGYWNKVKETAEVFTLDGWFKTGDIGRMDEQQFLFITDRKKELLKTSGGKLIAPQAIENRLKANVLVGQAALVGDKHKFASALISPNFPALEAWAREQGVTTSDRRELVGNAKVKALYDGIVQNVNGQLAAYESVKRIAVVPDEWSVEGGELTPSMKLKRRVIESRYAAEIGAFYADEADSHG